MYLLAYDINGTSAFHVSSYTDADLNGNPPFKISASVDAGYLNISSIENWWWFYQHDKGRWLKKDYKYYRHEIIILANFVIGWTNLSQEEKEIAAYTFSVGDIERNELYTLEEQIANGIEHHHESIKSRIARFEYIQIEIFNRIDKAYWNEIAVDLEIIKDHYLQEGREGTLEGDGEGLFDYLDGSARPGTSWDGNTPGKVGVRDKTFPVLGYNSCADFADHALDVFKNGNY